MGNFTLVALVAMAMVAVTYGPSLVMAQNRQFGGGFGVGGFGGRPGFGGGFGGRPGFGGGFGGGRPGFGGGFGGRPGFGGGFGGGRPGFGGGFGGRPGFGGGFGGFGGGFGGRGRFRGGRGRGRSLDDDDFESTGCRHWCTNPTTGAAFCCRTAQEPHAPVATKPGQCPPVRPTCLAGPSGGGPAPCSSDGVCGGVDKCCWDTCLQSNVCKPPAGFGR